MNKLILALIASFGLVAGAMASEKTAPVEPAMDSKAAMEDCSKITDAAAKKECEDKQAADATKSAPAK